MSNTEQLLRIRLQVICGAFLEGFENNTSNLNEQQKKAVSAIADILKAFKEESME